MGKDDKSVGIKKKKAEEKVDNNEANKNTIASEKEEKDKKKSKEKDDKKKKEKDPFEKISVSELQKKIEEMNDKIKVEQQVRQEKLTEMGKEVKDKESNIMKLGSKNKQYMLELEKIKKEIDKQLKGLTIREIQSQVKLKSKKQVPFEDQIASKEKELSNVKKLIKQTEKEKALLEKDAAVSNFNMITELKDKLAKLETENKSLDQQIKQNNKYLQESKSLFTKSEKLTKDNNIYQSEIRDLKLRLMNLDELHKDKQTMINKTEFERGRMEEEVQQYKLKLPDVKTSSQKLRDNNRSLSMKNKHDVKADLSKSLDQVHKFKFSYKSIHTLLTEKTTLFSAGEFDLLKPRIGEDKLNELEQRFSVINKENNTIEKKHLEQMKELVMNQYEKEEKIEVTTKLYKDAEQKSKLLQYQLNEYKNEGKILSKKKAEIEQTIKRLEKMLSDKAYEQELLNTQINEMHDNHKKHMQELAEEKERKKQEEENEDEDKAEEEAEEEDED